ncbi:MAG: DUF4124 domain-containing protein [Pseudomonadota bacterium]
MKNSISLRIAPSQQSQLIGLGLGALLIALLTFSANAQAKIYKWVDENGITQYTQYPPPDESVATEEIKTQSQNPEQAASAQEALQKRVDSLNERRSDKKLAAEEGEEAVAQRKQVQKFCDETKARLAEFESGRRLAEKQEDGSYVPVTEDQRETQIASMKAQIAENCQ